MLDGGVLDYLVPSGGSALLSLTVALLAQVGRGDLVAEGGRRLCRVARRAS